MISYYQHKVVWITGASSGIGRETAIQLSYIPHISLILSARNTTALQEVQKICINNNAACSILAIDLEQTHELEEKTMQAISLYGRIDIMIHNGGISQRSSAIETPIENHRKIMEIDYFSTIIITKTILPHMVERGYGHIVAISSISGCFGFPLRSAYCAAKHAMYGYYESLDIELRSSGICVTIVAPGRIQTNISLSALTKDGSPHGKMDDGQKNGMPVDRCVRIMLKGIARKKHEILIGGIEVIMAHIYRKMPRLFHILASKIKST